jgi:SnoaL-like domain
MSDLEQLLLEREICLVVGRYARMCDERDWSAMSYVFSDDASATYGGWPLRNNQAILAMLRRHLEGCGPTQHLLGQPLVYVDEQGTVTSRTEVRAAHRGAGALADRCYECLGQYHDRWTQTPNGLRIVHRRMEIALEFGDRSVLRPGIPQQLD